MKQDIKQKREELKALSRIARKLVEDGAAATINDAISLMYFNNGHTVLKSYRKWLTEGFQVKKGSKALLLWGQPKKNLNQEADKGEKEEYKFYPLAYLFSNQQVEQLQ